MMRLPFRQAFSVALGCQIKGIQLKKSFSNIEAYLKVTKRWLSCSQSEEALQLAKRRLMIRIKNTGMKELDIILEGYISRNINRMGVKEVEQLHKVLDIDTPLLYQTLIMGKHLSPDLEENKAVEDIRNYAMKGAFTEP